MRGRPAKAARGQIQSPTFYALRLTDKAEKPRRWLVIVTMRIPDNTLVRFLPNPQRDEVEDLEDHTGKVLAFTTDGFYRVSWDDPNPLPSFFNLGRVFRPDQIEPLRRQVQVRLDLVLELPNPGGPGEVDDAVSAYLADNDISGSFDVVDQWIEPR